MTIDYLRQAVEDDVNDFYFTHHGKSCGVEQEVHDSVSTYTAWCGDDTKQYSSFDDLIRDLFFDGDSIADIVGSLDIRFA